VWQIASFTENPLLFLLASFVLLAGIYEPDRESRILFPHKGLQEKSLCENCGQGRWLTRLGRKLLPRNDAGT